MVGLGVVRQLEAWRDGLVEVCCVRVTTGLSGRSWLGTPRRGKLGQGLAVLVNTKRAMLLGKECGGRGNSPLCGQGRAVMVWLGMERSGSVLSGESGRSRCGLVGFGWAGEAVKVRSGRVGLGEAVKVRCV